MWIKAALAFVPRAFTPSHMVVTAHSRLDGDQRSETGILGG
jgi:hypothetical protein